MLSNSVKVLTKMQIFSFETHIDDSMAIEQRKARQVGIDRLSLRLSLDAE